MSMKLIILQLNEHDTDRVLTLIQREAATGLIWNGYWQGLANGIRQQLQAQKSGKFFQCAACVEADQ